MEIFGFSEEFVDCSFNGPFAHVKYSYSIVYFL